jgi:hypothetical protein
METIQLCEHGKYFLSEIKMEKNIIICLVIVLSGLADVNAETNWTYQCYPGAKFTSIRGISGNSFVGYYEEASGSQHGFLFDGTNWITLDYPGATATYANSVSGNNIVGIYRDSSSNEHSFLYNGTTWTTLDFQGWGGVYVHGISGNNIVGEYHDGTIAHDGTFGPSGVLACIPSLYDTSVIGDLNGDDKVNFADYAILASHWLESRIISIASVPLDTNPNWITEGQWQFGQPTGAGGSLHGYPDPNQGFTGQNVYGVNLSGDYATTVGGPYCLTAGPFDCSGYVSVSLHFARWLNTDKANYVRCMVEVSNDAANWQTIWVNPTDTQIADSQWQQQHFNISSIADMKVTVYVRWSYEILNDRAFPYSGWNIDDIGLGGMITHTNNVSDLGTKAQQSNLVSTLQTIRSAIDLYKIQHNNNLPLSTSEAAFITCMTCYTDIDGNAAASQEPGQEGVYGPYMQSIPVNPFTIASTVTFSGADSAGVAGGGWHLNTTTGRFQADDSGLCPDGIPHTNL